MSAQTDIARSRLQSESGASSRTVAGICKAAADSLRVDILRVLSRDSFGVQELAGIFSMPQPGMSHHLKILSRNGLLVTRRQGNSIFYRRALVKEGDELDSFQASLYSAIDAGSLSEEYSRRIGQIYRDRSLLSREYFEKNADRFGENQGMLCELTQYLPALTELLDLVPSSQKSRVLEVGPGRGELLLELSRRFSAVVAIDSSQEMLSLARERTASAKNIKFVNSSLETFAESGDKFDAVILNMVMHHFSSPERSFQKLGQMVSSGGYVLVADLTTHDQQWARHTCGDVWLGFDSQDLKEWGERAGFDEEQASYLGLKNGFQIQLKLFRRK